MMVPAVIFAESIWNSGDSHLVCCCHHWIVCIVLTDRVVFIYVCRSIAERC